jgi:hypothetical protein
VAKSREGWRQKAGGEAPTVISRRRSTAWPPEIRGPRRGKGREVAAGRSIAGERGSAKEWILGFRASGRGLGGGSWAVGWWEGPFIGGWLKKTVAYGFFLL